MFYDMGHLSPIKLGRTLAAAWLHISLSTLSISDQICHCTIDLCPAEIYGIFNSNFKPVKLHISIYRMLLFISG